MRHLLFFTGIAAFITLILLSVPSASDQQRTDDTISVPPAAPPLPSEGTVCCAIERDGRELRCAAPPGKTCEACDAVCGAAK